MSTAFSKMRIKRPFSLAIALSLALSPVVPLKAEDKKERSTQEQIRIMHLETYGPVNEAAPQETIEEFQKKMFGAIFKGRSFTSLIENPTEPTKRDLIEKMHLACPAPPLPQNPAIDLNTVRMLELAQGEQKGENNLVDVLMGSDASDAARLVCADLLSQPIPAADIAHTKQLQNAVRLLAENDELFAKYNRAVNTWKSSLENLTYFYEGASTRSNLINKLLYFSNVESPGLGWIDNSSKALQISRWIGHPFKALIIFGPPALAIGGLVARKPHLALAGLTHSILLSYLTLNSTRLEFGGHKYLQQRMIGVADAMRSLRVMRHIIHSTPELKDCALFTPLDDLVRKTKNHPDPFGDLLDTLKESSTFQGNASHLSPSGTIRYHYKVMTEIKDEFKDLIRAGAGAEIVLQLAKLVRKNPERYCLVNFDTAATSPNIELQDFWNPFVSYHKDMDSIITNDIAFNGMRGMIVTGPNAGGKSTSMKAIMLNLILAQTFGIATARSCTITPFTKILCHLNTSDDTAGGNSGHMAQVQRFKDLLIAVMQCKPGEKVALMLDELFNATSPDQADELVYKALRKLMEYENVIFISPTHYPKATQLERDLNGLCKNFQVMADLNEDGRTVKQFRYKLAPGVSPIKNAEQVAASAGVTF